MSRPHPALLDLAAGRPLPPVPATEHDHLLAAAAEHRMTGLLWTSVLERRLQLAPAVTSLLAQEDLRSRRHNLRLWETLAEVQERLGAEGLEVVVAKGISTEVRWYGRTGERRCNDLDLVLAPEAVERIDDVVRLLQPAHPLREPVRRLVTSGMLQSIDLKVGGVEVDLHADLLKYEIPSLQAGRLFEDAVTIEGPGGVRARALSAEHSLVHFLLHLNKDNFARLLAYADIARILSCSPDLDLRKVDAFAAGEGLRVHVLSALHEVTGRLGLPPPPVSVGRGPRARLWQVMWPERQRLAGRQGLLEQRHRQLMIPWSAEGRLPEAATWWLRRRVLPPRGLVDFYYPETSGPYLWRLGIGRWHAMQLHRQVRRTTRPAGA